MSVLLFFHVLVTMLVVGGLITAAVAARAELWELTRRSGALALAGTIVAIALGEGLAADEDVRAGWLDAARALTVFGLLLGGAVLVVLTRPSRFRALAPAVAAALVLIALATAFVMAAKPS